MAVTLDNPDALYPPKDVAEFRHTSPGALAQERFRGAGPRYIRVGRRVLYRARDLADYLDTHTVTPQSATAQQD
ncbi:DNA-binding protein [Mycobacterium sp. 21AC1]|uniref:DNA-binding protein n=1 Tax=[Mycobacterium] appelbergii TaxID=2939269 RepID=UPI0029392D99|nr:DNA-binding protein [Mycobacterium sp. 21AC1]MDV3124672.1 DNA-binding protein [Mycobacterium sp. 21AC1]